MYVSKYLVVQLIKKTITKARYYGKYCADQVFQNTCMHTDADKPESPLYAIYATKTMSLALLLLERILHMVFDYERANLSLIPYQLSTHIL